MTHPLRQVVLTGVISRFTLAALCYARLSKLVNNALSDAMSNVARASRP